METPDIIGLELLCNNNYRNKFSRKNKNDLIDIETDINEKKIDILDLVKERLEGRHQSGYQEKNDILYNLVDSLIDAINMILDE